MLSSVDLIKVTVIFTSLQETQCSENQYHRKDALFFWLLLVIALAATTKAAFIRQVMYT